MTPNAALVCAADDIQAGTVSDDHPDFDVIPIQQDATPTGYFERKFRKTKRIAPTDIIADGTSSSTSSKFSKSASFHLCSVARRLKGTSIFQI